MAEFPLLPDDGVIEAGGFRMPCEICRLPIPCPINAFVGEDDDGDEAVFTEIITLDLEMHMLAEHGVVEPDFEHHELSEVAEEFGVDLDEEDE